MMFYGMFKWNAEEGAPVGDFHNYVWTIYIIDTKEATKNFGAAILMGNFCPLYD